MNWREHMQQAEMLLREAEQDQAVQQSTQSLLRVLIAVNSAQAHSALAEFKKKNDPGLPELY